MAEGVLTTGPMPSGPGLSGFSGILWFPETEASHRRKLFLSFIH